MNKTIFKVGDRVFDYMFGWGTVTRISCSFNDYPINVTFDDSSSGNKQFTLNGKYLYSNNYLRLSFTKYDFINGGFSQERPLPKIKDGQLVYVKLVKDGNWHMRFAKQFIGNSIECYNNQHKSGETVNWCIWSINNPLIEE